MMFRFGGLIRDSHREIFEVLSSAKMFFFSLFSLTRVIVSRLKDTLKHIIFAFYLFSSVSPISGCLSYYDVILVGVLGFPVVP